MSADLAPYAQITVDENGEEHIIINEHAYVNKESVKVFTFTFAPPGDITDSIQKRTNKPTGRAFGGKSGRIAYTGVTCHYPDDTNSTKIMFSNCVLDYRPKAGEGYGVEYVSVGVPCEYLDKVISGAKAHSGGILVQLAQKATRHDDHYWVSCNLDKMEPNSAHYVYATANGEHRQVDVNIREFMNSMESNLTVDILCTVSGTHTTASLDVKPDLPNVTYVIGVKPIEMFIHGLSDAKAPEFEYAKQKKETVAVSAQLVASAELARRAMEKLGLK